MKKLVLYILAGLSLTACGGDSDSGSKSSASKTPSVMQPSKPTTSSNILNAKGVRVIDGDTIEVLRANAPSERVRLLGIDAPESDQPYGKLSTENLKSCVDGKKVTIRWDKKDKYSRIIGKVLASGKDCNLKQIEDGYAWHYKQYQSEQSERDRLAYNNAEVAAKQNHKGLWASVCIIAPWDWRRGAKNCNTNFIPQPPVTTDPIVPSTSIPQPPVITNPIVPSVGGHTSSNSQGGCVKGKRCGNACIAVTKVCHK